MCNCIEAIEKKYTDLLLSQVPDARITESVTIQNKSLMLKSGEFKLYSEIAGRYEDGPRRRKFGVNVLYAFCPFCGERITEE